MEGIWRGLGLGRRAGIAGRHCEQAGKQAFRADIGRHSVLRTSYLRKICRSYGAWLTITLKWIVDTKYKTTEK